MRNKGLGFVYQPRYRDRGGICHVAGCSHAFRDEQRCEQIKTSPIWWVSYSYRGRKIRLSSNSTKRVDALRLLKAKLAEVGSGRPVIADAERISFEDLLIALVDNYKANQRRSLDKLFSRLRHLREFFGFDRAIDVTPDRIDRYVAHRLAEGARNATVNRELAAIRRAFRLSLRAGKVAGCPHIAMLTEHNVRRGFFDEDQFAAVVAHLPEDLKPVMQTAYITGWRVHSEILTRKKHHLDLDAGWLRLDPGETKNRQGRMFPLIADLEHVLRTQLERTREVERDTGRIIPWLFHRRGIPIRDFRTAWRGACSAAGVPGRIVHDFRRTAVRNLERAGVSRSAAMAMVGHETESIYRRYAIADETSLREAGLKLANLRSVFDRTLTKQQGSR